MSNYALVGSVAPEVKNISMEDLLISPLQDLESLSGIHSSYWCRWFGGAEPSEINQKRALKRLEITQEQFTRLICLRRKIQKAIKKAGRNFTPYEARRILKVIREQEQESGLKTA